MEEQFTNQHHSWEKKMARSKTLLTWCLRAVWREDPALRRIKSLQGCRTARASSAIPVFFTQKARLG